MMLLKLMRVHQYSKNLFVFLPLFFSGHFIYGTELWRVSVGFLLFSFAASAVYIINDIHDVEEDRLHPVKKYRPLASGVISISKALYFASLMLAVSLIGSVFLAPRFAGILLIYFLLNIGYSLKFKTIPLLDVTIIAIGFVLRVVSGGIIADVLISKWIVLMTFLLALLLAVGKRRDDVLIFQESGKQLRKAIKGYNIAFINFAIVFLASITLVCYIMYTVSAEVIQRLQSEYVYLTSIFVILGLLRYMQLVFVENDSGFPAQILLRDRFIQLILVAWVLSFMLLLY
jgi:decaprenyl-phosphate phosphoribosyltransferase